MVTNEYMKEIKLFAKSLKDSYLANSYSQELGKIIRYDKLRDKDKDFVMIPIRIEMEVSDFDGTIHNELLGANLGEDIANGEFNYIISKLKSIKEESTIETTNADSILKILNRIPSEFKPKFLLIPLFSKYFHNIHELVAKGMARYEKSEFVIYHGNNRVKVIWSNKFRPLDNNMYLLGEDAITWIVKLKEEMNPISNVNYNEYKELVGEESKLSVIYYEKDSKIDFIARVVGYVEVNPIFVRKYKISSQEIDK